MSTAVYSFGFNTLLYYMYTLKNTELQTIYSLYAQNKAFRDLPWPLLAAANPASLSTGSPLHLIQIKLLVRCQALIC